MLPLKKHLVGHSYLAVSDEILKLLPVLDDGHRVDQADVDIRIFHCRLRQREVLHLVKVQLPDQPGENVGEIQ